MKAIIKQAVDQEQEKLSLAAQKTIETLQNLIEDKDEQIQKKERLIDRMKKDFLAEKEKDAKEIKDLNN